MKWIDTHTHIYLDAFELDIDVVVQNAIENNIDKFLLPNIDNNSIEKIKILCDKYPSNCFPMVGLHPCDVKDNYIQELEQLKAIALSNSLYFEKSHLIAIGEIGLDYYWDKSFISIQKEAFIIQIEWALELNLPIVIHTRDALDDTIAIVKEYIPRGLRGVFHCFSGNVIQANTIIDMGFLLGIGGVLTYKNSGLAEVISQVGLTHVVVETDAPFLSPTPYRGKRNEPLFMLKTAEKLAEIFSVDLSTIAEITTRNANKIFDLK